MVLPRLGPANGCWPGKEHPVITICTDLRRPETFETVKSEIEEPENQESEFFSCCCFDSQSERLSEEAATCQRIDSKRSQEDRMRSLENQITVLTDKLENPPEEQRPAQ